MKGCRDGRDGLSALDRAKARPPRSPSVPSPQCGTSSSDLHLPGETEVAEGQVSRLGAGRALEDGDDAVEKASSRTIAANKDTQHRPDVLPNTVTSESHQPADANAATLPASSSSRCNDNGRVDADMDGKGKGKAEATASQSPRGALPALSSASSTSQPAIISFLDKVVAAPDAPRTVAISPYGNSHPLFLAAKKYRLQVKNSSNPSATSSSIKRSSSTFPDPVASSSKSTDTSTIPARASKEEEKVQQPHVQQDYFPEQAEEVQEQEQVNFRVPSLSRPSPIAPQNATTAITASTSTHTEDTMGSRPAYAQSQMRIARRPSPLDLPATKRRRSNDGGIHVVKVEEHEDETTFLITTKDTSREPSTPDELHNAKTSLKRKASSSRQPSPSSSSVATQRRRIASPSTSVDLRSSAGDEDCSCSENELRTPKMRVPLRLPRPESVQDLDLSTLNLDPSLQGVPLPYILDNIALRGPVLLSSVVDSSIALPSTSKLASSPNSGPAVPTTVAVRTPTSLAQDSALPEYALAVSSDDSSQVMFLPVHGLVLATNCKSFAGLARPPSAEPQSVEEGDDTIRVLPVVHIHLPSSVAFSKLVPFFYAREAGSLLGSLLPVQHLPLLSLTAAQKSPALLASHLAKVDQAILLQSLHFNHTVWKTAVALGAGKDELWKVLQGAWNALVAALSIQHKAGLTTIKTEEVEDTA